jgi:hypothetical protein
MGRLYIWFADFLAVSEVKNPALVHKSRATWAKWAARYVLYRIILF